MLKVCKDDVKFKFSNIVKIYNELSSQMDGQRYRQADIGTDNTP